MRKRRKQWSNTAVKQKADNKKTCEQCAYDNNSNSEEYEPKKRETERQRNTTAPQ